MRSDLSMPAIRTALFFNHWLKALDLVDCLGAAVRRLSEQHNRIPSIDIRLKDRVALADEVNPKKKSHPRGQLKLEWDGFYLV